MTDDDLTPVWICTECGDLSDRRLSHVHNVIVRKRDHDEVVGVRSVSRKLAHVDSDGNLYTTGPIDPPEMTLYAVWMSFGLYVVRASDEAEARRVAFEGPAADDDAEPARDYGAEFDPQAAVLPLDADGPAALLAFRFA